MIHLALFVEGQVLYYSRYDANGFQWDARKAPFQSCPALLPVDSSKCRGVLKNSAVGSDRPDVLDRKVSGNGTTFTQNRPKLVSLYRLLRRSGMSGQCLPTDQRRMPASTLRTLISSRATRGTETCSERLPMIPPPKKGRGSASGCDRCIDVPYLSDMDCCSIVFSSAKCSIAWDRVRYEFVWLCAFVALGRGST